MRRIIGYFFAVFITGLVVCGNLSADGIMTIAGLPDPGDVDTISIVLTPSNGAVDGMAGSAVGWGFTVTWTSSEGDWMTFVNPSSLGSETNPNLPSSYTDFIAAQGGPDDYALSATDATWTESFDASSSQGVGAYQITSDPTLESAGAQDAGQIIFSFQVYTGDPGNGGVQIGAGNDQQLDGNYLYSTPFLVTVDAPAASAPEPGTYWLLLAAASAVVCLGRRVMMLDERFPKVQLPEGSYAVGVELAGKLTSMPSLRSLE